MGHVLPSGTYAGVKDPLWIPSSGNPVFETVTTQILKATSVSTNTVFLQNNALTATTNVLALNGLPLATTENLSTIMDWSLYPAFSTINVNNNDIKDVNAITADNVAVNFLSQNATMSPDQQISVAGDLFFAGGSILNANITDTATLKASRIETGTAAPDVIFDSGISIPANKTLNVTGPTTLAATNVRSLTCTTRVSTDTIGSATPGRAVTVQSTLDLTGSLVNVGIVSGIGVQPVIFNSPINMNNNSIDNINAISGTAGLPITVEANMSLNNFNITEVNNLVSNLVSTDILSGNNVVGGDITLASNIQANGRNLLGVNLLRANNVNLFPNNGPGNNNLSLRTNGNGTLLAGIAPDLYPVPYGGRHNIISVGTFLFIPIPGMTVTGLAMATYQSASIGAVQVINNVTAGPNSIRVDLNGVSQVGDTITWIAIKLT